MLKNITIKAKLLTIVLGSIIIISGSILFSTLFIYNTDTHSLINKSTKESYAARKNELKNYVSLAYNVIESYYSKALKHPEMMEQMREEALRTVEKMKYGKNGYYWINSSKYVVLAHGAKPSLIGRELKNLKDPKGKYVYQEIVKVANNNKNGGSIEFYWSIPNRKGSYQKIAFVRKFEPWDMIIGTGLYMVDIKQKEASLLKKAEASINASIVNIMTIVLLFIIVISIVVLFALKSLLFNPLKTFQNGLLNFFKYVNKENKDIEILPIKSKDEIGKMSLLINENISKTKKIIEKDNILLNDVKEIVSHVGDGFLDKRITTSTNNNSLEELKTLLNTMLENLQELVGTNINILNSTLTKYANKDFTHKFDEKNSGKIGIDILNMNKMITKILQNSQEEGLKLKDKSIELASNVKILNENANSQAASLEETAASIEEITSNITQTSEKAQEMLSISATTQDSSNMGKGLASKTANSMDEINNQTQAIAEAITVIDQIAFQTNILSLNAAVEAATAGEAGKGFAVVAAEVRNLASRSAEAAKEIKELVEAATIKADEGKRISSSMIEGFNELEENIKNTSRLIQDVSNAAKEQSTGINQISDAVNQLDSFTQENASVADKTNTIAQETNDIAIDIVENVNTNNFDGKVNS